ncbi:hypothetical protein ACRZU1_004029 [Escherichia coli]
MSTSNNMGRTTQAQPKPGVNVCIVKKEITNKFNEIITNALAEQLVVLNIKVMNVFLPKCREGLVVRILLL